MNIITSVMVSLLLLLLLLFTTDIYIYIYIYIYIIIIIIVIMIIIKEIKVHCYKIYILSRPNHFLISLLNEGIDLASFASFENWLQCITPLNLKLLFGNALFGKCQISILI